MFTAGTLVLVMSLLRVFVIRLKETPKFLISQGRDAEAVAGLQEIAKKYNRQCDLTVEQLAACGDTMPEHTKKRHIFRELGQNISGLFATRKMALSTSMVWASWTLIGLAYPLFYVFLP